MKYHSEITPRGFSISKEEAEKSDLLLHLGLTNACFAIVNGESNQVKMIADVNVKADSESALRDLVQEFNYLTFNYQTVKISFDTFNFTFVPQSLYENSMIPEYGKLVHSPDTDFIIINRIPAAALVNVIAARRSFHKALQDMFYQPKIYGQVSPFLNGARRASQANAFYNVFVGVKPSAFEISIVKEDGLVFYNLFEFHGAEELNYFLLVVLKNFELTPRNSFLTLLGNIDENDHLFAIFKKYFRQVIFADSSLMINLPQSLRNISTHKYYSLLSLQLCD